MIRVRRAGPSDLDQVIELHRLFCQVDGHVFSAANARAAIPPLLVDDTVGTVWLAGGEDGQGYAIVTWGWSVESGGRDALIDEIYAHPPGAGIGARLMEAVIEDVDGRGITTLFLETEVPNEAARRFYRRFGFSEEESRWMARTH